MKCAPSNPYHSRAAHSLPTRINVDNGTEFTSKALDHWAYWHRLQLDFSRPGKPVDNTNAAPTVTPDMVEAISSTGLWRLH